MRDYLLGLATLPAVALAASSAVVAWRRLAQMIERSKMVMPQRRARAAARIFAARRTYLFSFQHVAVAVTLGRNWAVWNQAQAVLLDEFCPIGDDQPSGTTAPYSAPGMPTGAPERAREIAEAMPTVGQWPGSEGGAVRG